MKDIRMQRLEEMATPLCKFGPGGDFTQTWPQVPVVKAIETNPLGKVLDKIAAIMAMAGAYQVSHTAVFTSPRFAKTSFKEVTENVDIEKCADFDAKANSAPLAAQTGTGAGLFSNDFGTGKRAKLRTNNNLRTFRTASRKRTHPVSGKQGTFFEIDSNWARSA